MQNKVVTLVGALIALAGAVFALQGFGVLTGSQMSNTTTWSVAGPIIVVVGLLLVWWGSRRA
jgi:hypothetical protein